MLSAGHDDRKNSMKRVGSQWLEVVKGTFCLTVCATIFALCSAAAAQQPKPTPLIGILDSGTRSASARRIDEFRQALRELGYIERKNISIDYRYADGNDNRLLELAVELARLKTDVFVAAGGNSATRALKETTKTIPIVMAGGSDAVDGGIISSLARPVGNVTGLTSLWDDLAGKRLDLLKETIPKLARVAVLWNQSGGRNTQWKANQAAAQQLGLQVHSMGVRNVADLDNAFNEAVKARSGALSVTASTLFSANYKQTADLANK